MKKEVKKVDTFKGVRWLKIRSNHPHAFNLGFKLAKIFWPSWTMLVFAFIGLICSIYLLAGLRFYQTYGYTDFMTDWDNPTIWYYTSGLRVEHRWLRSGRGFTMHKISEYDYLKNCPNGHEETQYFWFYQKDCEY